MAKSMIWMPQRKVAPPFATFTTHLHKPCLQTRSGAEFSPYICSAFDFAPSLQQAVDFADLDIDVEDASAFELYPDPGAEKLLSSPPLDALGIDDVDEEPPHAKRPRVF